MPAPNVPFYGKDSDRLARLDIAYKALLDSGSFLENWPLTVANIQLFSGTSPEILRNGLMLIRPTLFAFEKTG